MSATRCAAVLAALLLAGCGSVTPSATPQPTPVPATPSAATTAPSQSAAPSAIKIGHLNLYAGDWAPLGASFKAMTDFTVEIINQDPPLGRRLEVIDKDVVTAGEAVAAKQLIEQDKVEVLFNVMDYPSYRDWMLNQVKISNFPAMTTVLGDQIPPLYGGTVEEPLMRGMPQDTTQAAAAVLYAGNLGAKKIAILATEEFGVWKEQALAAAQELGLEVALTLDIVSGLDSYGAEVTKVAAASTDAVLMFSGAKEGGTFVKEAAEAGQSWTLIGNGYWAAGTPNLPTTATLEAMAKHKAVLFTGTTQADGPAWDYYQPRFDAYAATPAGKALGDLPADGFSKDFYDILALTAQAIEQAGTTATDKWLPAMRTVAMAPGAKCFNYAECLALIRAGTEVDYSGATGEMDYTDTGVVSAVWAVFRWTGLEETERVTLLDSAKVVELEQAGFEAGVGQ